MSRRTLSGAAAQCVQIRDRAERRYLCAGITGVLQAAMFVPHLFENRAAAGRNTRLPVHPTACINIIFVKSLRGRFE